MSNSDFGGLFHGSGKREHKLRELLRLRRDAKAFAHLRDLGLESPPSGQLSPEAIIQFSKALSAQVRRSRNRENGKFGNLPPRNGGRRGRPADLPDVTYYWMIKCVEFLIAEGKTKSRAEACRMTVEMVLGARLGPKGAARQRTIKRLGKRLEDRIGITNRRSKEKGGLARAMLKSMTNSSVKTQTKTFSR